MFLRRQEISASDVDSINHLDEITTTEHLVAFCPSTVHTSFVNSHILCRPAQLMIIMDVACYWGFRPIEVPIYNNRGVFKKISTKPFQIGINNQVCLRIIVV